MLLEVISSSLLEEKYRGHDESLGSDAEAT
jgi:hypothetical protein